MAGQHLHKVSSGQCVGNQRHACQRQALAGQGGLHDLVGVVEIQPALGLQPGQVARFKPAAPAEPLQVLAAVRVARLDQGELGYIGRGAQGLATFEQPGARHHRQLLAKQAQPALGARAWQGVAQGQVHIRGFQVHRHVAGINADVNARVVALELFHARNQPHGCKAGPGGDGHAAAPRRLAHLAHGGVHALKCRGHGPLQLRTGAGQLHGPRMAQEQCHTHFFFQRLDLAAHGRLRERQLIGCGAEVQVPCHGQKGAPVAGGHGAGAQHGGGVFGSGHGNDDSCVGGMNSVPRFHWTVGSGRRTMRCL